MCRQISIGLQAFCFEGDNRPGFIYFKGLQISVIGLKCKLLQYNGSARGCDQCRS